MAIDLDPDVARAVATKLGAELDQVAQLEQKVRGAVSGAVLDFEGDTARVELTQTHAELDSLSKLVRLYADRVQATDAALAQQLDAQLGAALAAMFANGFRSSPADPVSSGPAPGESVEEYLARIAAAMTERRLRDLQLLSGKTTPLYDQWLVNAARNGVHSDEIVKIAREAHITPSDFDVLVDLESVTDNDGKTYFLVDLEGDVAQADMPKIVAMTYVLNAGTGYGSAAGHEHNDFAETPYSADEVQRITQRIDANLWTYGLAGWWQPVTEIHLTGGKFAATPNGMLMAMRGPAWHVGFTTDFIVQRGGTTTGDLFTISGTSDDPAQYLRTLIESGTFGDLDLDRVLHHEEIHSQQWAEIGELFFGPAYLQAELEAAVNRSKSQAEKEAAAAAAGMTVEEWELNRYEQQAGGRDGGYIQ